MVLIMPVHGKFLPFCHHAVHLLTIPIGSALVMFFVLCDFLIIVAAICDLFAYVNCLCHLNMFLY